MRPSDSEPDRPSDSSPPASTGIDENQMARNILESIPDAIFALDGEWRFSYVNATALQGLRKSREEVLGRSLWDLYPSAFGSVFDQRYRQALASRKPVRFEHFDTDRDRWYEIVASPADRGLVVSFRDTTERNLVSEGLQQLLKTTHGLIWHATVHKQPDGHPIWSARMIQEGAPGEFVPIDLATGEHYALAWDLFRRPADGPPFVAAATQAMLAGSPGYRQEFRCYRANGNIHWLSEEAQFEAIEPEIWRVIGVCTDITERKNNDYSRNAALEWLNEANEHLQELAWQDGLTGLKNHRALQERLIEEYYRCVRYNRPLSLVLIDVDRFKAYNDEFGHPAGDEVLRLIGGILQTVARSTDVAARYGGEEFALLVTETDRAGAFAFSERLCMTIAEFDWPRRAVTVSMGVSTLRPGQGSPGALIEEADRALYASKAGGRNRITHYDDLRPDDP